jgi:hypothetical protein
MNIKKLHGKDGEMVLAYKDTAFARVERFIEQTALVSTAKLGAYSIGTGYKARLYLDDVTITDTDTITDILNALQAGLSPEIGFHGKFRRNDGLAEGIIFRNCVLAGEIDLAEFTKGFVWEMTLAVNSLSSEQAKLFQIHG